MFQRVVGVANITGMNEREKYADVFRWLGDGRTPCRLFYDWPGSAAN